MNENTRTRKRGTMGVYTIFSNLFRFYFMPISSFILPIACLVWCVSTRYGRISLRDIKRVVGWMLLGVAITIYICTFLMRTFGAWEYTGIDQVYYGTTFLLAMTEEVVKWLIAYFLYRRAKKQGADSSILVWACAAGFAFAVIEGVMKTPAFLMLNGAFSLLFAASSIGHVAYVLVTGLFFVQARKHQKKWLTILGIFMASAVHCLSNLIVEWVQAKQLSPTTAFICMIGEAVFVLCFVGWMIHYNKKVFDTNESFVNVGQTEVEQKKMSFKRVIFGVAYFLLFILSFAVFSEAERFTWIGYVLFGLWGVILLPPVFFYILKRSFSFKPWAGILFVSLICCGFVVTMLLPLRYQFNYQNALDYAEEMIAESESQIYIGEKEIEIEPVDDERTKVRMKLQYKKFFYDENSWREKKEVEVGCYFDNSTGEFSLK